VSAATLSGILLRALLCRRECSGSDILGFPIRFGDLVLCRGLQFDCIEPLSHHCRIPFLTEYGQ
ncbi:unnamed protein product, partial [Urochloa humidicola]